MPELKNPASDHFPLADIRGPILGEPVASVPGSAQMIIEGCAVTWESRGIFAKGNLIFRQIIRIVWYEEFNRTRTVWELPVKLGLIYFFEYLTERC
jgi:hypothetical protein